MSKHEKRRTIAHIFKAQPTEEGAGVHLHRVFGYAQVPLFDPFLMLDDFRSENPEDYLPGFPWHPHRGIETATYMLRGEVEHGDSLGNTGTIRAGEIQWMTAGSGIVHQEMPKPVEGRMGGFQLWINLPGRDKMTAPRYRDVRAGSVPCVEPGEGVEAKLIAGTLGGVRGPVRDIVGDITLMDVAVGAGRRFEPLLPAGRTAFAYVYEGEGTFDPDGAKAVGARHCVLFRDGGSALVRGGAAPLRFLLACGTPLREPVAWRGPIVMNTDAELAQVFRELREGTFLRA
jgi:redox-sensitive bicupin YhaK (pirin superfamily)